MTFLGFDLRNFISDLGFQPEFGSMEHISLWWPFRDFLEKALLGSVFAIVTSFKAYSTPYSFIVVIGMFRML